MVDHSGMKLGKQPRREEARLRPLRCYMGATTGGGLALPPVPANCERGSAVPSWPMLDNDTVGDCTIAAVGHAVQLWTAAAERMRVMTDAEALAGYERFGYRPGDPSTDQGANAADVLTRWTGVGFACGGVEDVLTGFCAIDPAQASEVRAGVAWLGVVYAGLELPIAAQSAEVWDAPAAAADLVGDYAPGGWGGHAVPIVGYGPGGVVCVTWGALKQITWRFWSAYASEAYGLLSRDFVTGAASAATVDWAALEGDMADLRTEVAA
jgi:hypothetical protein